MGEIDLTSSLTLSSGDSLTLSKSPETAEVDATFNLGGAGNYTLNGFNLTAKSGTTANVSFDNTGSRYIYPDIGISLTDAGIVYNGVTYRKNSAVSGDSTVEFANHGSSGERIWLTNAQVVNASVGMKFYVEPEQLNGSDAAGQLIVDGVKINYDKDCEELNFTITDSGIIFDDDELGQIYTYNRSSGNNVVSFNIVNDNYSISESYVANILSASNGVFNYTGGDASISSYAGEKVNLVANSLTGIDIFGGDDFILNFSTGDLTVENARDKVIDIAFENNTIAYAAMASGALDLDASSLSQLLILVGGNNASNKFVAGSGGSWLWGGVGGSDTLTGGTGSDVFWFGKNDGTDFINNASSSDVVNLYDVSINDITSLNTEEDHQITIGLNTGANIKINSSENVSAKITMAEGSVNFNHSTKQWQLA